MIIQRLGAEEGDTPVERQPAAMQDFDPTYGRCGERRWLSWLPRRRHPLVILDVVAGVPQVGPFYSGGWVGGFYRIRPTPFFSIKILKPIAPIKPARSHLSPAS